MTKLQMFTKFGKNTQGFKTFALDARLDLHKSVSGVSKNLLHSLAKLLQMRIWKTRHCSGVNPLTGNAKFERSAANGDDPCPGLPAAVILI